MPNCQYHNLLAVPVIQSDIRPTSEFNYPLTELRRQLFDRTANFRMLAERFHALPDCLDRALGCFPALGRKKGMETGYIQKCRLRPRQS